MKVVTVYTASYSRYREDGLPGTVEVEDDCSYPMMFDTKESAIAGTREHAKKKRLDYITNSAKTQSRWAIQLDNGRRLLLSEDHEKAIPKLPKFRPPIKKSKKRWIVEYRNKHFLCTEMLDRKRITIWDGKGKPPGDYHTKLAIEDKDNYYLLDSSALIGMRVHYEISQMYKEKSGL